MSRVRSITFAALALVGCGQDGFLVTGSATGATTEGSNTTGLGGIGGAGGAGATGGTGASATGGSAGSPVGGRGGGGGSEICDNTIDDDGDLAIDCADTECQSTPVCAGLVINEVDYDQVGSDDFEFIEIYNPGSNPIALDGLSVVLLNGSDGADYDSTDLTGSLAAGAYLVVADAGVVAPGATVIVRSGWSVQQGPDGVALYDANRDVLVDGLSYGGDIGMVSLGNQGSMFSLVDGTATTAEDSMTGSLARSPNGGDTGDDATDWVLSAAPTAGAPNL